MEKRSLKLSWPHPAAGARAVAALLRPSALRAAVAAVLGTALLLGGCSKEPVPDSGGERVEIAPRVGLPGSAAPAGVSPYTSPSTRAEADPSEELALSFARSDESAEGVWGDYGAEALMAVRAPGEGQQALTFESEQYYLPGGLRTRLTGWYPGGGEQAGDPNGYYDAAAGRVSWTIDGGQDILLAQAQQGSVRQPMPAFTFSHALCRLSFRFFAKDQTAIAYWGSVMGVKVCGQRCEASFALADAADGTPALTFTGEASASFASANFNLVSPPVGTAADAVEGGSPVMIEPQAGPYTLLLEVTTINQGTHTVAVESLTYPAGQSVTVCVALGDHEITVLPEGCTITPWGEAEEVVPGAQSEYPYVSGGNTLVFKDMWGAADPALYPMHEPWTVTPGATEAKWNDNSSGKNTVGATFKVSKQNLVVNGKETFMYTEGKNACRDYFEEDEEKEKGTWRLPTIRELKAIADLRQFIKGLYNTSDVYRTANWYASQWMWNVDLNTGKAASNTLESTKIYVLCVRDVN